MFDYVFAGGGITALELGALLSREGASVLILEKAAHVGGRAFLWEKNGFTADYGIHLVRFGPRSALSRVCRRLGYEIRYAKPGKSRLFEPDGSSRVFPTDPLSFILTDMFSTYERLRAVKAVIDIRRSSNLHKLYRISVKRWLDETGMSGGLRRYFELLSSSMLVCPFTERASAGELLINVRKVLRTGYSALYPSDGWKPIFDLFLSKIGKRGEVRTGCAVEKVLVSGGRTAGVVAAGHEIQAETVVINLPAQQVFSILDEKDFPLDFVKTCGELRPTAGISIDYGLSRRVSDSRGLSFFTSPVSFGLFTSNLCPAVAPEGRQLFTVFMPAEIADIENAEKAAGLEQAVEQAAFMAFPEMASSVLWRRPMRLKMVDGAEVNVDQIHLDRPDFRAPGVENLFFVGDSTCAHGAGGDVGHESAVDCFKEITGRELPE